MGWTPTKKYGGLGSLESLRRRQRRSRTKPPRGGRSAFRP